MIDQDGVVIWIDNFPDRLSVEALEKLIAVAEAEGPWDPGERHSVLKRAVKSAHDGKLGSAWRNAEAARKSASKDPEAMAAIEAFQAEIVSRAECLMSKAEAMATEGRYFQAAELLEVRLVPFKGAPFEKDWKKTIKAWSSGKEFKVQYGLDKERRKAIAQAQDGDIPGALKSLEKLLEEAEGLPIAAIIRFDYDQIRAL